MTDAIRGFFREVSRCRLCYSGHSDIIVPLPDPLPPRPRLLVIGEQPCRVSAAEGRNGMDGSEPGSQHLRSYLERAGVDLGDVLYVTAVLCLPEKVELRAGRPTATETKQCARHLRKLVERVQPKLVVPLGHTGLLSMQFAFPEWTELRQFILNYDIGAVLARGDLTVYPLYLPSASTLNARPEGRQLRDWQKIPGVLESLEREARTG
ncbi:MAG: uracil-DNA glycosylase family protein [bacterium]